MAKLYFYYGAMGSSKTANALMTCFNYGERHQKALLVKPGIDVRGGDSVVNSRIGLWQACISVNVLLRMSYEELKQYSAIVIDEAQFATSSDIDYFAKIVDELNIPVLCYGLRADFQNKLFPGSERLLTIADTIKEIKTICWCGKKATCNARYNVRGIVRDGDQVMLGANSDYTSLCRNHFNKGNLGPDFLLNN